MKMCMRVRIFSLIIFGGVTAVLDLEACVRNSSRMPHPIFLKLCMFSRSEIKMCKFILIFDSIIFHDITAVFGLRLSI